MSKEQDKQQTIAVVCVHPLNCVPGQRLRWEQYLCFLDDHNLHYRIFPLFNVWGSKFVLNSSSFFLKVFLTALFHVRRLIQLVQIRRFHTVFISLHVSPFSGMFFERLAISRARRFVFDLDDAVFLGNEKGNFFIRYLRGSAKYIWLVSRADSVIVSSEAMSNYVKSYAKTVCLMPISLDGSRYRRSFPRRRVGLPVVGWSGSRSTARYLDRIRDIFLQLRRTLVFDIVLIGAEKHEYILDNVRKIPFTVDTEINALCEIDIGVYPLDIDEWTVFKAGGKVVQYLAMGIPCIADDTPQNRTLIVHGVNGFLVTNHHEWCYYIRRLLLDDELLLNMSQQARLHFEAHFDIMIFRKKFLAAFGFV